MPYVVCMIRSRRRRKVGLQSEAADSPSDCLTGADEEHGVHAPHDNRQGGAPGFGAPPLRAGIGPAGGGPSDSGPLAPSGGRGFGLGRGRGLKGAVHGMRYSFRTAWPLCETRVDDWA